MPNWCENRLYLDFTNASDEAKSLFQSFKEACAKGVTDRLADNAAEHPPLFGHFIPMPDDVANDWGYWAERNWGVNRDVFEYYASFPTNLEAEISFDSAWSPPIEFYNFLVRMGVDVCGYYVETSMDFAGMFLQGQFTEFQDLMDKRDRFLDYDPLFQMLEPHWEWFDEQAAE